MEYLSGKELAAALNTSQAFISRMKQSGYIDHEPETSKYDLEKAKTAYAYLQDVKSGVLINLTKTAEILSTSKSNVTQMTNAGKLEVVEVGTKEVFYKLKAIEAIKQSRIKEETEQKIEDQTENELKIKLMQVDLERKELDLAEKKREVMPIEIVQQQNTMLMHKIDEFLSVGGERITQSIRHCQNDDERRQKIDYELSRFFKELKRFMQEQSDAS